MDVVCKTAQDGWLKPLHSGWRRHVYVTTLGPGKNEGKRRVTVCYEAPAHLGGLRYRTPKAITRFLESKPELELGAANFTFGGFRFWHEPEETVTVRVNFRGSSPSARRSSSPLDPTVSHTDSHSNQTDSIGNQADSIGNQTERLCNQADSIGNQTERICIQADSIGNQADSIDKQVNSLANQSYSIDNQTDRLCNQADIIGNQAESLVNKADSLGNQPDWFGNQVDSLDNQTFTTEDIQQKKKTTPRGRKLLISKNAFKGNRSKSAPAVVGERVAGVRLRRLTVPIIRCDYLLSKQKLIPSRSHFSSEVDSSPSLSDSPVSFIRECLHDETPDTPDSTRDKINCITSRIATVLSPTTTSGQSQGYSQGQGQSSLSQSHFRAMPTFEELSNTSGILVTPKSPFRGTESREKTSQSGSASTHSSPGSAIEAIASRLRGAGQQSPHIAGEPCGANTSLLDVTSGLSDDTFVHNLSGISEISKIDVCSTSGLKKPADLLEDIFLNEKGNESSCESATIAIEKTVKEPLEILVSIPRAVFPNESVTSMQDTTDNTRHNISDKTEPKIKNIQINQSVLSDAEQYKPVIVQRLNSATDYSITALSRKTGALDENVHACAKTPQKKTDFPGQDYLNIGLCDEEETFVPDYVDDEYVQSEEERGTSSSEAETGSESDSQEVERDTTFGKEVFTDGGVLADVAEDRTYALNKFLKAPATSEESQIQVCESREKTDTADVELCNDIFENISIEHATTSGATTNRHRRETPVKQRGSESEPKPGANALEIINRITTPQKRQTAAIGEPSKMVQPSAEKASMAGNKPELSNLARVAGHVGTSRIHTAKERTGSITRLSQEETELSKSNESADRKETSTHIAKSTVTKKRQSGDKTSKTELAEVTKTGAQITKVSKSDIKDKSKTVSKNSKSVSTREKFTENTREKSTSQKDKSAQKPTQPKFNINDNKTKTIPQCEAEKVRKQTKSQDLNSATTKRTPASTQKSDKSAEKRTQSKSNKNDNATTGSKAENANSKSQPLKASSKNPGSSKTLVKATMDFKNRKPEANLPKPEVEVYLIIFLVQTKDGEKVQKTHAKVHHSDIEKGYLTKRVVGGFRRYQIQSVTNSGKSKELTVRPVGGVFSSQAKAEAFVKTVDKTSPTKVSPSIGSELKPPSNKALVSKATSITSEATSMTITSQSSPPSVKTCPSKTARRVSTSKTAPCTMRNKLSCKSAQSNSTLQRQQSSLSSGARESVISSANTTQASGQASCDVKATKLAKPSTNSTRDKHEPLIDDTPSNSESGLLERAMGSITKSVVKDVTPVPVSISAASTQVEELTESELQCLEQSLKEIYGADTGNHDDVNNAIGTAKPTKETVAKDVLGSDEQPINERLRDNLNIAQSSSLSDSADLAGNHDDKNKNAIVKNTPVNEMVALDVLDSDKQPINERLRENLDIAQRSSSIDSADLAGNHDNKNENAIVKTTPVNEMVGLDVLDSDEPPMHEKLIDNLDIAQSISLSDSADLAGYHDDKNKNAIGKNKPVNEMVGKDVLDSDKQPINEGQRDNLDIAQSSSLSDTADLALDVRLKLPLVQADNTKNSDTQTHVNKSSDIPIVKVTDIQHEQTQPSLSCKAAASSGFVSLTGSLEPLEAKAPQNQDPPSAAHVIEVQQKEEPATEEPNKNKQAEAAEQIEQQIEDIPKLGSFRSPVQSDSSQTKFDFSDLSSFQIVVSNECDDRTVRVKEEEEEERPSDETQRTVQVSEVMCPAARWTVDQIISVVEALKSKLPVPSQSPTTERSGREFILSQVVARAGAPKPKSRDRSRDDKETSREHNSADGKDSCKSSSDDKQSAKITHSASNDNKRSERSPKITHSTSNDNKQSERSTKITHSASNDNKQSEISTKITHSASNDNKQSKRSTKITHSATNDNKQSEISTKITHSATNDNKQSEISTKITHSASNDNKHSERSTKITHSASNDNKQSERSTKITHSASNDNKHSERSTKITHSASNDNKQSERSTKMTHSASNDNEKSGRSAKITHSASNDNKQSERSAKIIQSASNEARQHTSPDNRQFNTEIRDASFDSTSKQACEQVSVRILDRSRDHKESVEVSRADKQSNDRSRDTSRDGKQSNERSSDTSRDGKQSNDRSRDTSRDGKQSNERSRDTSRVCTSAPKPEESKTYPSHHVPSQAKTILPSNPGKLVESALSVEKPRAASTPAVPGRQALAETGITGHSGKRRIKLKRPPIGVPSTSEPATSRIKLEEKQSTKFQQYKSFPAQTNSRATKLSTEQIPSLSVQNVETVIRKPARKLEASAQQITLQRSQLINTVPNIPEKNIESNKQPRNSSSKSSSATVSVPVSDVILKQTRENDVLNQPGSGANSYGGIERRLRNIPGSKVGNYGDTERELRNPPSVNRLAMGWEDIVLVTKLPKTVPDTRSMVDSTPHSTAHESHVYDSGLDSMHECEHKLNSNRPSDTTQVMESPTIALKKASKLSDIKSSKPVNVAVSKLGPRIQVVSPSVRRDLKRRPLDTVINSSNSTIPSASTVSLSRTSLQTDAQAISSTSSIGGTHVSTSIPTSTSNTESTISSTSVSSANIRLESSTLTADSSQRNLSFDGDTSVSAIGRLHDTPLLMPAHTAQSVAPANRTETLESRSYSCQSSGISQQQKESLVNEKPVQSIPTSAQAIAMQQLAVYRALQSAANGAPAVPSSTQLSVEQPANTPTISEQVAAEISRPPESESPDDVQIIHFTPPRSQTELPTRPSTSVAKPAKSERKPAKRAAAEIETFKKRVKQPDGTYKTYKVSVLKKRDKSGAKRGDGPAPDGTRTSTPKRKCRPTCGSGSGGASVAKKGRSGPPLSDAELLQILRSTAGRHGEVASTDNEPECASQAAMATHHYPEQFQPRVAMAAHHHIEQVPHQDAMATHPHPEEVQYGVTIATHHNQEQVKHQAAMATHHHREQLQQQAAMATHHHQEQLQHQAPMAMHHHQEQLQHQASMATHYQSAKVQHQAATTPQSPATQVQNQVVLATLPQATQLQQISSSCTSDMETSAADSTRTSESDRQEHLLNKLRNYKRASNTKRLGKTFIDFITDPAMQPHVPQVVTMTTRWFDVDSNVANQFRQFINFAKESEQEKRRTTEKLVSSRSPLVLVSASLLQRVVEQHQWIPAAQLLNIIDQEEIGSLEDFAATMSQNRRICLQVATYAQMGAFGEAVECLRKPEVNWLLPVRAAQVMTSSDRTARHSLLAQIVQHIIARLHATNKAGDTSNQSGDCQVDYAITVFLQLVDTYEQDMAEIENYDANGVQRLYESLLALSLKLVPSLLRLFSLHTHAPRLHISLKIFKTMVVTVARHMHFSREAFERAPELVRTGAKRGIYPGQRLGLTVNTLCLWTRISGIEMELIITTHLMDMAQHLHQLQAQGSTIPTTTCNLRIELSGRNGPQGPTAQRDSMTRLQHVLEAFTPPLHVQQWRSQETEWLCVLSDDSVLCAMDEVWRQRFAGPDSTPAPWRARRSHDALITKVSPGRSSTQTDGCTSPPPPPPPLPQQQSPNQSLRKPLAKPQRKGPRKLSLKQSIRQPQHMTRQPPPQPSLNQSVRQRQPLLQQPPPPEISAMPARSLKETPRFPPNHSLTQPPPPNHSLTQPPLPPPLELPPLPPGPDVTEHRTPPPTTQTQSSEQEPDPDINQPAIQSSPFVPPGPLPLPVQRPQMDPRKADVQHDTFSHPGHSMHQTVYRPHSGQQSSRMYQPLPQHLYASQSENTRYTPHATQSYANTDPQYNAKQEAARNLYNQHSSVKRKSTDFQGQPQIKRRPPDVQETQQEPNRSRKWKPAAEQDDLEMPGLVNIAGRRMSYSMPTKLVTPKKHVQKGFYKGPRTYYTAACRPPALLDGTETYGDVDMRKQTAPERRCRNWVLPQDTPRHMDGDQQTTFGHQRYQRDVMPPPPPRRYGDQPTSPQRSQYGAQPTPQRSQYGGQPTPQRSRYGDQPTPQRSQYGDQPTPQRSQYGDQPTPQRSQYGDQSMPQRSQYGDQPTPQRSQYGDQPTPQHSQYGDQSMPKRIQSPPRGDVPLTQAQQACVLKVGKLVTERLEALMEVGARIRNIEHCAQQLSYRFAEEHIIEDRRLVSFTGDLYERLQTFISDSIHLYCD